MVRLPTTRLILRHPREHEFDRQTSPQLTMEHALCIPDMWCKFGIDAGRDIVLRANKVIQEELAANAGADDLLEEEEVFVE